ncbi:acetyl-CoA hydrolase/transferase family protein [Desulfobulbus alkaliphilus]|uniref:acetyl-CoA hydrolase/transferase family protein n=1 Tax=Desulfobulbus alkaliphilus TaxID=869814 RepID=UPI001962873D|nr:acetyl-CoA hydrolase/transferase C-terminal domain-containing protein [Desulfobulbus alkaliphilus]MBM9537679.1 butyryl-CoA:acetate CoA-transferase [Desulfobulbus alkaliphilus]
MGIMDEYKRKCVSADEAVKVVKSGDWVDFGSFCGQVRDLDKALAERKDELKDIKIWSLVNPYPTEVNIVDPTGDVFTWNSWHLSGADRKIAKAGKPVYYSSMKYSELPRYVRERIEPINVAMIQVCPMDKHGFFNFGPQCTHTKAACDQAKIVIVEVNEKQPRCLGGYEEGIHISEVDYIVEGTNQPLTQIPAPPMTDVDRKVAEFIMEEIRDGSCIQLGIGGMPNAVGMMIAESDLKDLGCHTEMLVDAYVHMVNSGRMNGTKKNIDPNKLVYTFALGTNILYDFIDDNPQCAIYPVNYTNKPSNAALNDNLITINNAVEVDIYGQVCSESAGTRHISGTGGQLDFVLAGWDSKGGKSFVCLPSANVGADGSIRSRIVPTLAQGGIVTDPRSVADVIVTEYGKFAMKGMTVWQRAEGLIGIAHPAVRDELVQAAEAQGIWRRSNKV